MGEYVIRIRRGTSWAAAVLVLLVIGLVIAAKPGSAAGNGASVALSLKVVPTIRSVTVSPGMADFGNCTGGSASADTPSTPTALGYPNGRCWVGNPGAAHFPITITYKGPPGRVFVAGSDAIPAAGFTQWGLCDSAATCTGPHRLPGLNQYLLWDFGSGSSRPMTLTGSPVCDQQFGPGGCSATPGQSQKEGFELIGPSSSGNTSQSWLITVMWTVAPP